jgi:hypothetical protein
MGLKRIFLLTVSVSLILSQISCLNGGGETDLVPINSKIQETSDAKIGNLIGDQAPDFSVLLTNGETVSYATLRNEKMPTLLFFFSPY